MLPRVNREKLKKTLMEARAAGVTRPELERLLAGVMSKQMVNKLIQEGIRAERARKGSK